MSLLSTKNLHKAFGGIHACRDCNFDVEEGKITGLIGPNGAGKTTVFNLISGLDRPDPSTGSGQVAAEQAQILFRGEDLVHFEPHEIARMGIARTFQLIKLFPRLSIIDNLLLARALEGESLGNTLFRAGKTLEDEKSHRERVKEWLEFVGLGEKAASEARYLSYGQQKLVEIARVLSAEADLLLLDEPVAGVNPRLEEKIAEILRKLKAMGKTIFLIEHDMPFVMNLCDRILVMAEGKIIASGSPTKIKNNPEVLEAYLGKQHVNA